MLSKILSATDDEDEIRMVCAAIEMVFRAQMTYVHVAFDKCGSVMMPNLLRIMERAENGKIKHAGKFVERATKFPFILYSHEFMYFHRHQHPQH